MDYPRAGVLGRMSECEILRPAPLGSRMCEAVEMGAICVVRGGQQGNVRDS